MVITIKSYGKCSCGCARMVPIFEPLTDAELVELDNDRAEWDRPDAEHAGRVIE